MFFFNKLYEIFFDKGFMKILFCILSYLALFNNNYISNNDVMGLVSFIALYILYKKYLSFDSKYLKSKLVLSSVFSFLFLLGNSVKAVANFNDKSFIDYLFVPTFIVDFMGFIFIFYIVVNFIVDGFMNYKFNNDIFKSKHFKLYIFFLFLGISILYFIRFYPGFFTYDSFKEIDIIMNNFKSLSNHHPVCHILFTAFFYKIGMFIFNDVTISYSLSIIAQFIIMSYIIAYCFDFLNKRGVSKKLLSLLIIFMLINSIIFLYFVTMWKDILFAGFFLLFCFVLYELYEDNFTLNRKYICISLLVLFFRNNAIYMYLMLFILFLFIIRNYKLWIVNILIIAFYFLVTTFGFNYFHVVKSSSAEYIGIPMQMISRVVYKDEKIDDNDVKLINDVIPVNEIKLLYNYFVVDSIKLSNSFNIESFNKNKLEYLKLFLRVGVNHKSTFIEGYLTSTVGYWYPFDSYWVLAGGIHENNYGIQSYFSSDSVLYNITSSDVPFLYYFSNIGIYMWLFLILFVCTLLKFHDKYYVIYLPSICLWLTLMIASPDAGEYRYVFSIILMIPFLIGLNYRRVNE